MHIQTNMLIMVIFLVIITTIVMQTQVCIFLTLISESKLFRNSNITFFKAKQDPISSPNQDDKPKIAEGETKSITENFNYPPIIVTSHLDSSIRFWNEEVYILVLEELLLNKFTPRLFCLREFY